MNLIMVSYLGWGLNLLGFLGLGYALLWERGEDPRFAGDKLIYRS